MKEIAFLISYPLITIIIIILSNKFKFLDKVNKKKIHLRSVPNTLGLSIYFFLFLLVISYELSFEIERIIAIGFFIVILGFVDDRTNLSPGVKITLKSIPIIFLILNDFNLDDLGEYEFIGKLYLGKFAFLFVFLGSLLLINSFNYIDGIDGLLLSLSATIIIYYIFLSNFSNDYVKLLLYFFYILIISLALNLLSSSSKFKSFSGNSGSLFLGFFFSFLMIYLYKKQNIHPSYLIWGCWYPVYDFLYVTGKRILNMKNPSIRDNSHLHYRVLKIYKGNQIKTLICINFFNIVIILLGLFIAINLGNIFSLAMFIILFIFFIFLRRNFIK